MREKDADVFATPHMMTGAAIGRCTRKPLLALPIAFASHFILDLIPHLDSHALFGNRGGEPTAAEAFMAILDFCFGLLLVFWAVRGQSGRKVMLGAALAAILIDLVDNVPPWNRWVQAWPGTTWFSSFHHSFQHNLRPDQWILGFSTQIAVVIIALWVIRWNFMQRDHKCSTKASI